MAHRRSWLSPWNAALICAVLILSALFILESDDCYFFYWKYDSLLDFLLTRPDTLHAKIVSVPQNGRYLGNLLGVCLAKCFESPLFPLRMIFFSGGFFLLSWGAAGALAPRERRGEAFFFLLAMLLLAHRGIWQEVYGWGAAYANYFTPMAVMCCLPALLRRPAGARPWRRWALLFVLGFACCLFMETVTLFLLAASSLALLWQLFRPGCPRAPYGFLWLGAAVGAAVMFTAPGYASVGSDGLRQAGVDLVCQNLLSIFIGTVVRPALPALIITGFLLWHLRRQGCRRWIVCALAALPLHLVCLAAWCKDLADPGNLLLPQPSLLLALTGMALAALWLVMLLLWRGGQAKRTVLLLVLALCLFSAPLLVVSIGGNRNFFPGFVVLCLVCLTLYLSARQAGLELPLWPRALALLSCCALIFVFGCNCLVYRQRLSYAREQAAAGAEQVTLPLLPFAGFARNEQEWKGDLSYQIYRETPWDVTFTFVSYQKWTASGQSLGGDGIDA